MVYEVVASMQTVNMRQNQNFLARANPGAVLKHIRDSDGWLIRD